MTEFYSGLLTAGSAVVLVALVAFGYQQYSLTSTLNDVVSNNCSAIEAATVTNIEKRAVAKYKAELEEAKAALKEGSK